MTERMAQAFLTENATYIRDLADWLKADMQVYINLRHPRTKENALKRIHRLQQLLAQTEQAITSLESLPVESEAQG